MKSKILKLAAVFGLLTVVLSTPAYSQTSEEMKAIQEMAQAEVKLLFIVNMNLTDQEGEAFWPIYDQYRAELMEVGLENSELLRDFILNYETMTDTVAADLTDRYFAGEQARLAVRMKYRDKMAEVLPAVKVARFVQIENKLIAIAQYQLASEIPMMQKGPGDPIS